MLVCTQHFRAAELHSQDNDFARSRKTCSNSSAMMHGHHFGPPGAHHFGGHPSMGDHPCRMGPMGGGRGWRHRRARGPCGDRAFERDMPIDMIETEHSIQIVADVPGASKESIQIEADQGVLIINVIPPDEPASADPSAPPHPVSADEGPADEAGPPVEDPQEQAEGEGTDKRRFIVQQRPKRFSKRVVELPEGADAYRAEASCRDGVLTITIPREPVPESKKKIPVA